MSVENIKKHSGQLSNTGVRVAVVYRKLPNDESQCLLVETERLPDSYHDYLLQIMNSRDAKETNDLFEILNRRTFPDGTNCLTSLHQRGFLRKEPVSNVTMLPLPGHSVPLGLINATIDKKVEQYNAQQKADTTDTLIPMDTAKQEIQKVTPTKPITGDASSIAMGLIFQAELLEQDATAKREEAYTMDPSLRPKTGGRKPLEGSPEEVIQAKKARRLERDRENAIAKREAKKEAELDAKVATKLQRDAAKLT